MRTILILALGLLFAICISCCLGSMVHDDDIEQRMHVPGHNEGGGDDV